MAETHPQRSPDDKPVDRDEPTIGEHTEGTSDDSRPISAGSPASCEDASETQPAEIPSTDVRLAGLPTGDAPSLPATIDTPRPPSHNDPVVPVFAPGVMIEDFEILGLLGKGAFGAVYRAKQISLAREVAVKVSLNRGSEGRTLARFEHPHIVQVYTESPDSTGAYRLLCMQLVPGCSLDRVIRTLRQSETKADLWNGQQFLDAITEGTSSPVAFEPSALTQRESLVEMDAIETATWMGIKLAEALDYAHTRDVLHRDIKPANILIDPYGRPFLADFNIAHMGETEDGEHAPDETFGGTLLYMAPEHLEAFHPHSGITSDAVTEQSDIYSLAIVLHELVWLRSPFPREDIPRELIAKVEALSRLRSDFRLPPPPGSTSPEKLFAHTIADCLAGKPELRPASGAHLARRLTGLHAFSRAINNLPAHRRFASYPLNRPFLFIILFAILPHLAGSAVNIAYNHEQIVSKLTEVQHTWFIRSVGAYNAVVYPIAVWFACRMLLPIYRTYKRINGTSRVADEEVASARKQALKLPVSYALIAILGWFPGGLLFPLAIDRLAAPLPLSAWLHFIASFTLSGLIALAYSYAGVQFVALRVLYPQMWVDPTDFTRIARSELASMPERHSLLSILAGSIPLLAAILLLLIDPADDGFAFRLVIISLIFLGLIGYQIASTGAQRLTRALAALTTG